MLIRWLRLQIFPYNFENNQTLLYNAFDPEKGQIIMHLIHPLINVLLKKVLISFPHFDIYWLSVSLIIKKIIEFFLILKEIF
jgi:hypothetical protein